MQKNERQAYIRQLIQDQIIERQSDFVTALEKRGVPVTQATISRDIKDMQLVKVPTHDGRYRYSMPEEKQLAPLDKLRRTLAAEFRRGDMMDQFVHLVMNPGTAPAVGNLIDQLQDQRIFATIAGDGAILIVCRSKADASSVLDMITAMVG
ncbi:arginine repressor [Lacticaseibacillus jixiensis]|uniref:arginine repressor n=1 Tax=Lacticaseibacillus jixiensis TaxID=3231926 RepID=UPI0036F1F9A0